MLGPQQHANCRTDNEETFGNGRQTTGLGNVGVLRKKNSPLLNTCGNIQIYFPYFFTVSVFALLLLDRCKITVKMSVNNVFMFTYQKCIWTMAFCSISTLTFDSQHSQTLMADKSCICANTHNLQIVTHTRS